jgi:hypothetical protein
VIDLTRARHLAGSTSSKPEVWDLLVDRLVDGGVNEPAGLARRDSARVRGAAHQLRGNQSGGVDAHGAVRQRRAVDRVQLRRSGFTATDFTTDFGAGQLVEKTAEIVVRLAAIGPDGPTGTVHEATGPFAWQPAH